MTQHLNPELATMEQFHSAVNSMSNEQAMRSMLLMFAYMYSLANQGGPWDEALFDEFVDMARASTKHFLETLNAAHSVH